MKIEKQVYRKHFSHYYINNEIDQYIFHGLWFSLFNGSVGYYYHNEEKGFWLICKEYL